MGLASTFPTPTLPNIFFGESVNPPMCRSFVQYAAKASGSQQTTPAVQIGETAAEFGDFPVKFGDLIGGHGLGTKRMCLKGKMTEIVLSS